MSQLEEKSKEMKALEVEVEKCSDYSVDSNTNPKREREEISTKI